MAATKTLKIKYTGDVEGVQRALGGLDSLHRSFGSRLLSIGKTAAKGVAMAAGAAGVALAGVGAAAVKAAAEAERVGAQTEAVLKSTGHAAGVTAKEVGALAQEIMSYSGISDEAVQSAENVLLTFTGIRNAAGKTNDIFNQATKAAADLSVAMGQDLKSSAILVGKALNDPVAGLSALTRVGVRFTAAQKEQIAAMVESGNVLGAQKQILAELTKEFGGSAKALGSTATGAFNIMRETIGNTLEDIGGKLLKVGQDVLPTVTKTLTKLLDQLGPALTDFFGSLAKTLSRVLPAIAPILADLGQAIGKVLQTLGPVLRNVLQALAPLLRELAQGIGQVLVAIAQALEPLLPDLAELLASIQPLIPVVVELATGLLRLLAPALQVLIKVVTKVVRVVVGWVANWRGAWEAIKTTAIGAWNAIKGAASTLWRGIQAAIVDPIRSVKEVLVGTFRQIREALRGIWNGIRATASTVWRAISGAIKGAVNLAIDAINALIRGMNRVSGGLDWAAGPWLNWGEIPQIPHLARGGTIMRGGLALVGERGPEVVALGRGSSVIPLQTGGRSTVRLRARLDVRIDRRMLGRAQEVDVLTSGW